MPIRAFCLREPSNLFISFETLRRGPGQWTLSSLSSFLYSLRLFFVFFASGLLRVDEWASVRRHVFPRG